MEDVFYLSVIFLFFLLSFALIHFFAWLAQDKC